MKVLCDACQITTDEIRKMDKDWDDVSIKTKHPIRLDEIEEV